MSATIHLLADQGGAPLATQHVRQQLARSLAHSVLTSLATAKGSIGSFIISYACKGNQGDGTAGAAFRSLATGRSSDWYATGAPGTPQPSQGVAMPG